MRNLMKTLNYYLFAALALLLVACKESGLTPVSNKIQGPLGEYFEVVSREYKAKDGKISIEIKRIEEGFPEPWEERMEVGYSKGTFTPQFSVEFLDGDGNVIGKDATDIVYNKDALKSIAALNIGESASITLNCTKDAKQFKVSSTFEINTKDGYGSTESFTTNLSGKIGSYAIQMTLNGEANGEVTGAYYYKKKGPKALLYVKGTKNGNTIFLSEFTKEGKKTGTFQGTYSGDTYQGDFTAESGKYSFLLTEDKDMETLDLSSMDFDSFALTTNNDYTENEDLDDWDEPTGSEDWDALLQSYEQYVDKLIAFTKKAEEGDLTAVAEYPTLLMKAEEFSKKLANAKGEMSASQWSRYYKITLKMSNAAQEMGKH